MRNPEPAPQVIEPEKVARRVFCRRYSDCLDYALSRDWEGFSCMNCSDFERIEMDDPKEWLEDAALCEDLIDAVLEADIPLPLDGKRRYVLKSQQAIAPGAVMLPSGVARALGIDELEVYELCEYGKLRCIRLGGKTIRILGAALLEFVQKDEEEETLTGGERQGRRGSRMSPGSENTSGQTKRGKK